MSTLSNTVAAPRVPVLADLYANSWARNAVLVFGGALFMALFQQISIPVPPSPVPVTGGTLAVMLIGSALGSRRGAAAIFLYLMLGLLLPVYSEGRQGAEVLVNSASSGYFLGYLVAAYVVGRLAERGEDRRFVTAFASFIVAQLIVFGFGVPFLKFHMGYDWATALDLGFLVFIFGGLIKAAIGAVLMPSAWKLAAKIR